VHGKEKGFIIDIS